SVAAFEDEIDDCGRNRQLLLARQIKQRLQLVGERLDGRQIKKARAPLERVKRTENGIEYVHVRGIFLEDEYSLLDILQVLLGFVEELAEQFGVLFDIEHNYGLGTGAVVATAASAAESAAGSISFAFQASGSGGAGFSSSQAERAACHHSVQSPSRFKTSMLNRPVEAKTASS